MVQVWLAANIDFMLFLHGVAMLLLAGVLYAPGSKKKFPYPEFNLQVFSIGICINQWIAVVIYIFPGMRFLFIPGVIVFAASFFALLCYSISSIPVRVRWIARAWFFFAVMFAAYISVKSGTSSGYASLYQTIAFPSSLLAAWTFFYNALKSSGVKRAVWILSAGSMFVYSIAWLFSAPFEFSASGSGAESFCQCIAAMIQAVSALGILLTIYAMKNENSGGRRYLQEKYFFLIVIISVMALSWLSALWRGETAGSLIKNETLRHARAVANAINPEKAIRLKFSSDDNSNPVFARIREQMISYGHYAGLRSLYSFAMIRGKLVFGPENLDRNDPMASPPGTVYLEPHPDFMNLFSEAVPGVIGPYKDEYGSFVSGYAPVIDPRSGSVLMAVAIDISAESWRRAVSSARFAVFIITFMLVSVIMFMAITLALRRERWKGSASFAVRQLETVYIFCGGAFLSLMIFFLFNDYENRKAVSDFIPLSDSVAGVIRENIANLNYDLENLAKFFRSSERIDRDEFKIFTSEMRFTPVKRRGWYRRYRKGGRESYPLIYVEPSQDYKRKERSLDLSATDSGKNSIDNSLSSEMASFVSYEESISGSGGGKLMTVILPVYKKKGRAEGFVSLTADISLVLSRSMSFSKSRNLRLDSEIIDITEVNHEERLALYSDGGPGSAGPGYFMQTVYPVFIFDRVLGIKVAPSQGYVGTHMSGTGAMGLLSALMLTFAVTILSAYIRRREYSLEDLVAVRTRELSESRERFRTLHEASFGGIAIHDRGLIMECNEGLARMTGYTIDELIGMDGKLLLDPAWRDFVSQKINTGYAEPYDVLGLRKDGSVYPVEINGKNIPYHGKQMRVTEFRDITERKRTEDLLRLKGEELEAVNEELQAEMEEFEAMNSELIDANQQLIESEEKFSKAFSINPSAMVISSLDDGEIFEVNASFLHTFGYTKDEVIGKTVFDMNIYDDPEQRDLVTGFVREEGFIRNLEIAVKTSSGETKYVLLSADFVTIHDRKYMLTVMTDITERKRIDEAMKLNEKRYRLLFETAVDAIMVLDGSVFTDCNTQACRLFLRSREEILGSTPGSLTPEFQPDGTLSSLKIAEKIAAAYSGTPQFFEWLHSRSDGTTVDCEVALNAFSIGDAQYLLAIVRDITEKKRIEMRLSHMQKMDAIGQLAGGVAHDFNNQLSGILGYAEILSMRLGDSGLKKYSDGIISVAMRSADLTKKLLAFARKGQFQLARVDMHNIIDETVEILQHSIDRRISIIKKYNSAQAVVSGDPAQLQNALLNLGLNARDAMREGGILTFETEEIYLEKDMQKVQIMDVREGDYISVSITDTGCGLTDAARMHLFEPFFTTKESGKGTGMGLASVYGTVKNHNGTISVYSEAGIGTTFRIYLPLIGERGESIQRGGSEQLPDVPPLRILVVDDEDIVRGVLSEMLKDLGHSLIEASNGMEGVSAYRDKWREIDLVIIDMIMPEMNGRDAFLEMKRINPDIKAILSSGFSMDEESQMMLTEGVMGFIHKPYRKSDLIKKIKEIIK